MLLLDTILSMQITIISVGKPVSGPYLSLIAEYQKRLTRNHAITWHYLPPSSSTDPSLCRQQETRLIFQNIKSTDAVILLDERGTLMDNAIFATVFERHASTQGRFVFIVGGAFGVTDELRSRADTVWSMSTLVFPHQLIRVMLMEQLYRTVQLQAGHPYHHV